MMSCTPAALAPSRRAADNVAVEMKTPVYPPATTTATAPSHGWSGDGAGLHASSPDDAVAELETTPGCTLAARRRGEDNHREETP